MLAVAVSFLAALYLLGPDLVSRWMIGFVAPRKSAPTNRGEEVTRAVLWAAIPLTLAVLWVWWRGVLGMWGRWSAVDTVYACLSTTCSGADRANLWSSLRGFLGMNFSLLWREYLFVAAGATIFAVLIANYGRLRQEIKRSFWREALALLVTPQIADWHVWLSGMLRPEQDLSLVADVLTKNGMLYQGTVGEKVLGSDGSLQTLTLVLPRRFLRDDYRAAKNASASASADRDEFWREIPGSVFIILASDIVNLNIFYVRQETKPPAGEPTQADKDQIRRITNRIAVDSGVGLGARGSDLEQAVADDYGKGRL